MHTLPAFFKLVRMGMGACVDNDVRLDAAQWAHIADLASEQALSAIVLDGIARLSAEQAPPRDVLLRLIAVTQRVEADNRHLNVVAAKATARLGRDGLPAVVLKGQGLAVLYPNPLHRTPGDIDLWVKGSRAQVVDYARRYSPHARVLYHHVDFNVVPGVPIELHFVPSWMYQAPVNRRMQCFFESCRAASLRNAVMLPEGAGAVAVPTVTMNRVFILAHICRHLFTEGVGLRQLADYYFVLRQPVTDVERAESLAALRRLHLYRLAGAVGYVLQAVFGLDACYLPVPPSEERGRRLLREVLLAGNFGKYDTRIRHSAAEGSAVNFVRRVRRDLTFVADYPGEALWSPVFKLWHYGWRRRNGYL